MQGYKIIISPNGNKTEEKISESIGYEILQNDVGGLIDIVSLQKSKMMHNGVEFNITCYANDEGALIGLPVNGTATNFVQDLGYEYPIWGTLVILLEDDEMLKVSMG